MNRKLAAAGLLAAALAFAGPAFSAEYWLSGKSDRTVIMVDRSSERAVGDNREALALVFNIDKRFDPKEAYVILNYEFDCAAKATKIRGLVVYGANDEVIDRAADPKAAFQVERPGTFGNEVLSMSCGTKPYPVDKGLTLAQAKLAASMLLKPKTE